MPEMTTPDAVQPEFRLRMIAESAYYRYLQRDFADGSDVGDWLAAEAEIDARCGPADHLAHGVVGPHRFYRPAEARRVFGCRALRNGLVELGSKGHVQVLL